MEPSAPPEFNWVPSSAANGHGPGHGLAGMRERAELLGGSLSAAPAPGGGFAVPAVLPSNGTAAKPSATSAAELVNGLQQRVDS